MGTSPPAISDGILNAILARLRHWSEAELPAAASPGPPGVSTLAAGYDADLNALTALTASQAQAVGEHYARHAARYAKHVVLTLSAASMIPS